jgi:hypothetical protein
MKTNDSFGRLSLYLVLVFALLFSVVSGAGASSPPTVSNLYVPIEGTVALSNNEVVNFSGQVHVLTRVTFSDTFVPAVQMYVNLIGVQGTSPTTGKSYLLVGASNAGWVGLNPGPPDIPEQTFNFSLVETSPGPPNLPPSPIVPVYLHEFTFAQEAGFEGTLLGVEASFVSD